MNKTFRVVILLGLAAIFVAIGVKLELARVNLLVQRAVLTQFDVDRKFAATALQRTSEEAEERVARSLREQQHGASLAQQAIIDQYQKVYCADHSGESEQQKQETIDMAALLSKLALKSGIAQIALAEYRQCKP